MDFSHYGAHLTETGHVWGFLALYGERVGVKCRRGSGGIFPTLCVEFCLVTNQSSTKPNLVAKILVTFGHMLPKLVASICSQFDHLVNTGLAVGSLVKWLPIKVANPSKTDKFEWFIAHRLEMAPFIRL